MTENNDTCTLCGRAIKLTFHHLIPKTCHSNKWFRKKFSKQEMKTRGIYLCLQCHSFIHRQFSGKELGKRYNTLEALLQDDKIQKFLVWVKKQKI